MVFFFIWALDGNKCFDMPCFRTVIDRLLTYFGNKLSSMRPSKKTGPHHLFCKADRKGGNLDGKARNDGY